MFTTLQIEMTTAVSKLIYEEGSFEKYELKEQIEPNEFKRCIIKMPRNEDYGNGCALITRRIDDQWYIGIMDIWIDEDSKHEDFSIIGYKLIHEQDFKYKNVLMLNVLKWVDKIIGDDPVYNTKINE